MNHFSEPIRTRGLRLGAVALLATIPLIFGGCMVLAAGAVGAGAVAYVRGELEANLEKDLTSVFHASQRALKKLEFAKISDQSSGVDAHLVSRTALDKRVEIKLTRVTDGLTKVEIRVGVIGDQSLSMTILDKIKADLE